MSNREMSNVEGSSERRFAPYGGCRAAACVVSDGGFLVDKLGGAGLDDWEVEILDFVPSTAKPATRQVLYYGKMRKRLLLLQNKLSACGK